MRAVAGEFHPDSRVIRLVPPHNHGTAAVPQHLAGGGYRLRVLSS
jgi:hypothetical protein